MTIDYKKEFKEYLQTEKTLASMMINRTEEYKGYNALKYMENGTWKNMSWEIFGQKIRAVGKALLEMGIKVGDSVAIFSQNRPEWAFCDLGILSVRGITIPIYATNSAEEAEYIIDDAGVKVIFTGDQNQYDRAKECIGSSKTLTKIIAFDKTTQIDSKNSLHLDELLSMGENSTMNEEFSSRLDNVKSDDILTIIYTSGTTGNPKGAVHTHKSFMAGIFPPSKCFPWVTHDTVSLAILPLSHVFERMWSYACMSAGVQIAYCPDPKKFVEVMQAIKPELLTSVPRIWEKVYGTINEGLKEASPVKKKLFYWAQSIALEHYKNRNSEKKNGLMLNIKHKIADILIMKKVRAKLGCDNNRVYHIGGAAFATKINEFFQSFGINIIQGYGLTEFFPVCVGYDDLGMSGACGPLIPMVEVRIGDGREIQLNGLNVMKEYYKKPEPTKDMFTEDGWFKTGDVGELILKDGYTYIKITDRIKDLIITSGGKNISPQQIELLFGDELMVEQTAIVGDGRKFISVLIVPSFEQLEDYATKNNITFKNRKDLIENPEIIKLYEKIVDKNTQSLGQVEKIKKINLLEEELTQEAGELTPTLKLKRRVIEKKYEDRIEKMYS